MIRYIRLWFSFLRMSWMADLEFRTNIVLRVIGEMMWYVTQLSVWEVLYTHTNSIAGWDVSAMRVFMGTLFLVDVLYMILIEENMNNLTQVVKKGDLDLYLVKPINSQFMVSLRKVSVSYVINLMIMLGYLTWALMNFTKPISTMQAVLYCMMIPLGVVICYAIRFMFATLVIVLQDAGNIQFMWFQFYRLATRPDPIYPKLLRYIVLSILPVAFLASVPSRVLVEGIDPLLVIASPCVALGLLFLSNFFWERALRRYASASS